MDRGSKIALWCVGLWILGLFIINRILAVAGSTYPMLNAYTPNPQYNESLVGMMLPIGVGWTILCGVIAFLWSKAVKP